MGGTGKGVLYPAQSGRCGAPGGGSGPGGAGAPAGSIVPEETGEPTALRGPGAERGTAAGSAAGCGPGGEGGTTAGRSGESAPGRESDPAGAAVRGETAGSAVRCQAEDAGAGSAGPAGTDGGNGRRDEFFTRLAVILEKQRDLIHSLIAEGRRQTEALRTNDPGTFNETVRRQEALSRELAAREEERQRLLAAMPGFLRGEACAEDAYRPRQGLERTAGETGTGEREKPPGGNEPGRSAAQLYTSDAPGGGAGGRLSGPAGPTVDTGLPPGRDDGVRLSLLAGRAPEPLRERLHSLRRELLAGLEELRRVTDTNRYIIRWCRDFNSRLLKILGAAQVGMYGADGSRVTRTPAGALDRSV